MSVIELIRKRKSVRSYTGEPLSETHVDAINKYIEQLTPPFEANVRVQLIRAKIDDQPIKLGTYGVISGATDFLLLICGKGLMSEIGAGYMFEQIILYCTQLGLGTCWLGGTLKRNDFLKQVQLSENEELIVISPVGYKREKRTFVESIMRAGAGSDKRKPFGSLFFNRAFKTPLTEADAGSYKIPLEMVRLAPSASNKQPWRIVMQEGVFHFYHHIGRFSINDIGISLCHFELTCKELGLKGHFEKVPDVPMSNDTEYTISWITE